MTSNTEDNTLSSVLTILNNLSGKTRAKLGEAKKATVGHRVAVALPVNGTPKSVVAWVEEPRSGSAMIQRLHHVIKQPPTCFSQHLMRFDHCHLGSHKLS